jgi:magnesium chelatase family protein
VLVPRANAPEAALVEGIEVFPIDHLAQAVRFLRGEVLLERCLGGPPQDAKPDDVDLADVRGQGTAKEAIEIAAAGGHNLLMVGAPGGGKTMLARRIPSILPPLSNEEALEVTRIYSVAGLLDEGSGLVRTRPFRAPHHSVSTAGLVGGGSGLPQPGEISLAHRGVLFLDEVAEFRRDALEALRAPVEDGAVTIVRSRFAATYPARFQLVAAMNPCPCGHLGDDARACKCLPGRLASYKQRISGPMLDRMDLCVNVDRLQRGELFRARPGDPSAVVRDRVERARLVQEVRLSRFGLKCNAEIPPRLLDAACPRTPIAANNLERTVEKMKLTGRGGHRLLRVARTIADLDGTERIEPLHVDVASGFRIW